MLESLVASLLNRFLGSYVQNFDPTQLNIGIWGGDVRLRNLDLKREALDKFRLPLDVLEGHLGELTLQIPWSNLKGKPVKVVIQDLFILAAPKLEQEYDADDEERRAQALKQERLANSEMLNRNTGMTPEEAQKNQSFTESLVTKIVDNLQVTIKNLHIRYEDSESVPGHPFAAGLTLAELSAVSTDGNWNPTFVQDTTEITKKLAKLEALSIYWNSDSSFFERSLDSRDLVLDQFRDWFEDKEVHSEKIVASKQTQYILRPVSGIGKISVNKSGVTETMPRLTSELSFDDLAFVLDSDQYRDVLWTAEQFQLFTKTKDFRRLRPVVSVKENPKAWFVYAATVVKNEIHDRERVWSWDFIHKRMTDRVAYVSLYKKKALATITSEEVAALDQLEWDLDYHDIRFYRSLANTEVRKEVNKPLTTAPKQEPATWSSWFWGGAGSGTSSNLDEVMGQPEPENLEITEQQRKELYDAIEWDEKQQESSDFDTPAHWVTMEVSATLKTGSFRLHRDPAGGATDLAAIVFNGFSARFLQRPSSFVTEVSLQEFRVDDLTKQSLYEHVVTVYGVNDPAAGQVNVAEPESSSPFFELTFESNPIDKSADSKLAVQLKSMTIYYNKLFLESIVSFFQPPQAHLETIGAIMNAAGATVEGLRNQTRIGLEYALDEHKTVDVQMDLQAPLVVIPLDVTASNSSCAIIDSGHMSIVSDLASREILDDIKKKQSHAYTDEDWTRLEGLMYDRFKLQLHDTQVLIGPNLADTMVQLRAREQQGPARVIDRINMDFTVEISILPQAQTLTRFKVSGHLPIFRASMSDIKYQTMMKIIENSIPNFSQDSTSDLKPLEFSTRKLQDVHNDDLSYGDLSSSDNTSVDSTVSDGGDNQKLFEFQFQVDKFDLSLHRSRSATTFDQDPLVELVLEGFRLAYHFKAREMVADVVLNRLAAEDFIDTLSPKVLRTIVSGQASDGSADDLFSVHYLRQTRPVQVKGMDVNDQTVVVNMSTLQFVLAPKSALTLLDFVMTTFRPDIPVTDSSEKAVAPLPPTDALIEVHVNLKSTILVLNNDGIQLATLTLDAARFSVRLVAETMVVTAAIGNLALQDDLDQGVDKSSPLRQLLSIEGDGNDLLDMRYEVFAPDDNRHNYNSEVFLRSSSVKLNVVEEPLSRIFDFMLRLGQMKTLFDAARQAAFDQASNIQDPAKIHLDVVIKTPIVVFPIPILDQSLLSQGLKFETLTAHLGELYVNNTFSTLETGSMTPVVNDMKSGIRATRLTSKLVRPGYAGLSSSELINNLDLAFDLSFVDPHEGMRRPQVSVSGRMSNAEMRLSELQLRYIMDLLQIVPRIFQGAGLEDDDLDELQQELRQSKNLTSADVLSVVSSHPDTQSVTTADTNSWDRLAFSFRAGTVSLALYQEIDTESQLTMFALNDLGMDLKLASTGRLESDLYVHSFTIYDTRTQRANKFPEILPSVSTDEHQFMCRVTSRGNAYDILLTIDSPRLILALDYVFAVKSFVDYGLRVGEAPEQHDDTGDSDSDLETLVMEAGQKEGLDLSFHINIVESHVILLADPANSNSEAIVFKVDQMVLSQRETTTLSVSKIGMFMCRMKSFDENRLRVLDDFSVTASLDTRESDSQHQLANVQINVEPLVLRLSMRDLLLMLNIFQRASVMSGGSDGEPKETKSTARYSRFNKKSTDNVASREAGKSTISSRKRAASGSKRRRLTSSGGNDDVSNRPTITIVRGQKATVELEGFRFVLIGMHHEIPMLDLCVKPFTLQARNWSSDLKIDLSLETFTNIYNFAKSAWEPLVESWDIGLHISREQVSGALFVNLFSRRLMQVTVTSQTILLVRQAVEFMQEKSADKAFLEEQREPGAPYRIKNETGFELEVWNDSEDSVEIGGDKKTTLIADSEEIPWSFYDWRTLRENLGTGQKAVTIGLRLKDSPFDDVHHISFTSAGEHLYILKPRMHGFNHRLVAEISLEKSLKRVVLRGGLRVANHTSEPLDMAVQEDEQNASLSFTVAPGSSRAVPIQYCYNRPLLLRPELSLGFQWSSRPLLWKELLEGEREVQCPSSASSSSPYYFQVKARYDETSPLALSYPVMTVVVSAPVELVNLLPYDFAYRIYDKKTRKDWTNHLRKGQTSKVHVVQLSHLLLLSVYVRDAGFDRSDFAIINSPDMDEFKRESSMTVRSNDGQKLQLHIHYVRNEANGRALQVVIYTPYLILNKTGLDMQVRSRMNTASSKMSSWNREQQRQAQDPISTVGTMWSFDTDDRTNRATIRFGDSAWSSPVSFDAIGSDYEVVVPSSNHQAEIHVGVAVTEGRGRYRLTKVVEFAPRFIINNGLDADLQFKDPDSPHSLIVKAGEQVPVHFLRHSDEKQLIASFLGNKSPWSAPFNIANVGRVHLKMIRRSGPDESPAYVLVRVDIMLQKATLFLQVSDAGRNWPFSLRNFTGYEFIFYQVSPYVDEQGIELPSHPDFAPIKYRLPAKSVMPYSWDYPGATVKEILIECNGRRRRVQLAEIGTLPPMKIPPSNLFPAGIVDLDVVADGPTQTLVISSYDPSSSLYQLRTNPSQVSASSETSSANLNSREFSANDSQDDQVIMNFNVKLEGVGISLINRKPVELCYITLRGFEFNYRSSELYDTFSTKMKWVQIDNQLYGGIYPIVLFPSVVPKASAEMDSHPTLSASVTRVKDDSHGVLYIKHATVLLQQLTVEIDEDFLFALVDFARATTAAEEEAEQKLEPEDGLVLHSELTPSATASGLDVYFEMLHIQPSQFDLSFVRTERLNDEKPDAAESTLTFMFNILTMAVGNINDAPVKLNALVMENVRTPLPMLMGSISTHYSQEFLYQVHKILGSADLIGNPVGLFNNLSSGFMDIFYEPYQGYILNDRPQELGIGIAKGGLSFLKKSVFGVSDSISKVTGSISKGLTVATMDKEFQNKRRMNRTRNRPQHALYGLATGANSLVEGVTSGIQGLALNPMEGAAKEGAAGFFKGLGRGLVGLPTKTAIGIFDFASNLSEGVRNTTTVFDTEAVSRVRPSRHIGHDGIVRQFSEREAVGQSWLKIVKNGMYFEDEYLAHLGLGGNDMVVMVSFQRIMLISTSRMDVDWEVEYADLQTVAMERTGLALVLRGGVQGPFVPISDATNRKYLYRQIGVAVREFNRKYQTTA